MYWMILLSAFAGAALAAGGFYAGYRFSHIQNQNQKSTRKKKPRPPECYIVEPGEPAEERKPARRTKSPSGGATPLSPHVPGTDIQV